MENSTETLTALVGRVALALEAAVVEHGPEAVDLALLVYQIEAVKALVLSFFSILPVLFLVVGFKKFTKYMETVELNDLSDPPKGFIIGLAGGLSLFASVFFISNGKTLLSPAHWIAAFGQPELLIATKALEAAGVL